MTIFGKILFVVLLLMLLTPIVGVGVVLGWLAGVGALLFAYMWIGFLLWFMGKSDGYLTYHWLNNWFIFSLTWAIRPLI